MYEENTTTDTEEQGSDQDDSEDLSNVYIGLTTDGDIVTLQRLLSKVWRTQGTVTICLESHGCCISLYID